MKKNFLKISLAFCFLAMLGVSSFNLNASGGGGGGGDDPIEGYYLRTVNCDTKPGSWSYCDTTTENITCELSEQHECI